jgi:septum formation protein
LPLTDEEIRTYIKTGEPMDKAASYAAQGRGALFIQKIEGDYFNVVGLPLYRLNLMLKEFDIHLLTD